MNKLLDIQISPRDSSCTCVIEINDQALQWSGDLNVNGKIQGIEFSDGAALILIKEEIDVGGIVEKVYFFKAGGKLNFPIDLRSH